MDTNGADTAPSFRSSLNQNQVKKQKSEKKRKVESNSGSKV